MDAVNSVNKFFDELEHQLTLPDVGFFFIFDMFITIRPTVTELQVMLDFYHYLETHDFIRKGTRKIHGRNWDPLVDNINHRSQQLTNLGKITFATPEGKTRMRTDFLVLYQYIKPVNADDEAGPPAGPVE